MMEAKNRRAAAPDCEAFERSDDTPVPRKMAPSLGEVWQARLNRREMLRTSSSLAVSAAALSSFGALAACSENEPAIPGFEFEEISHGVDETHHVAPDHEADVLLRWGDPLTADAPPFDPENQSVEAQLQQFGYNNDFIGLTPLPFGDENTNRFLLCVNHEFTNDNLMHRALAAAEDMRMAYTPDMARISMAAHGGSIIEIVQQDGKWKPVQDSPFNRRITALETEMTIDGPAAGHARLQTSADPAGRTIIGTFNNCAGGMTPWGTYLMAEENFHGYFGNALPAGHPEARNYERYGIPGNFYPWFIADDRFDLSKEPNEANRFGWIVEVDPYDPTSRPIKHTALGRCKHEGCETIIARDGRLVVYSGDDQRFEYVYKFVSDKKVDTSSREANKDVLSSGTLYVARFNKDGTGEWLPLVFGQNGLGPENDFHSQADVLIETRRAADILDATPLDRPEDVEPHPSNGHVYMALTNNSKRTEDQTDTVNPRAQNLWGQIVDIQEDKGDHTSTKFTWDLLVKAGNPADPAIGAAWNEATSENGWFACPDNVAIDPQGRLWAATDQGGGWPGTSGTADGFWALGTEDETRGLGRMFFRVPVGAEMCGPRFTPDGEALFLAVQHPAADGAQEYEPHGRPSTYLDPATRWPDFDPALPPRPSVVVVTRKGGGKIG